jgi:RNA polymerase sigma factor (sigma-70 family)
MRTDDGSIIYECLNGEPEAFGVLVDKYKEGIYAFVYHKLRDFQDAQDVTQEVFLHAYRGLRSLRKWESFSFWLYRIAYARCSQYLRVRSKRVDREFIEDQDSRIINASSLDSYRDSQQSQSLREALDALPEMHREVLVLRYFGGMNSKEIARAIGTSPGAIRVRLNRARAQLKEEMVAMMDTAFEGQEIPAGFTLRIVEAVRHIKINPMPRMAGLPWGLSAAVGIIITALTLNPHLSIPSDTAMPFGSPLSVEAKVLKAGEIPVNILKIDEMSVIVSKQGNNDGGKPNSQEIQNAFVLAPERDKGGTWTRKADMPTARRMVATCVVDGKIYAIAGVKPASSEVEVYDPETNTWARRTDMPTARVLEKALSVVNGKVYAIGGFREGEVFSTVEEYDPKTDTWTQKADMPTARGHASACAVNGKIYAIGGCKDEHLNWPGLSIVEEYDPATDTWTRKKDMPTARLSLDTVAVNGRIFAIGGIADLAGGPILSTMEEYDPVKDTWMERADMSAKRWGVSAAVVDGKIYAIGGAEELKGEQPIFPPPEVYDPATDTWTELTDMQAPRMWLSSSAVNGKIYAIGGAIRREWDAEGDNDTSAVEEFTPEDWQLVSPQGKLPTKWGDVKSN